ncbi:hypothetical protein BN1723_005486 [Verticillium longisporum]|uniref:Uncharacterized protein n=1 Tax=Verticillium longisporum TaxID=100787 RepID=A0A0G4N9M6_VERLO|nr:hypothetical protein BN1723_005486 [Verticillium longisporum]
MIVGSSFLQIMTSAFQFTGRLGQPTSHTQAHEALASSTALSLTTAEMRIHAPLGVLAFGLLGLTSADAFPPDDGYGGGTCAPTATTTVFVTVPATNAASPPFVAGPQTVTVTIPASGNGAPGNPLSPVYTVTVQTFGPAIKRGKEGEPVWYWTPGGLRRLGSRFMKFRG